MTDTDTHPAAATETDQAWVTVASPFTPEQLRRFIDDEERLLRINSGYVFEAWQPIDADTVRATIRNQVNERTVTTDITVARSADAVTLTYAEGLKRRTVFVVETGPDGLGVLRITDDYGGGSETERRARMDEVDQTLVAWGHDLYRYMRSWKKWGRLRPWRWYMGRVWQPMKPMARRIAFMLIVITAIEFVAFLLVFAVFWLGLDSYLDL